MIRAMDRHRADKHHAGMEHLLDYTFFDFAGLCKEGFESIQQRLSRDFDGYVEHCFYETTLSLSLSGSSASRSPLFVTTTRDHYTGILRF